MIVFDFIMLRDCLNEYYVTMIVPSGCHLHFNHENIRVAWKVFVSSLSTVVICVGYNLITIGDEAID